MKVLIVDDCMVTRELLAVPLAGCATVDQAENGKAGLEMVKQALAQGEPYDLICLDLNMPQLGGHDTLREIRLLEERHATGGRATIFMITASSDPDDMVEALMTGECDDYLTKPVISKTFLALLKKHGLID